ncbi:hypothetical protein OAS39_10455, partial [Pirellulales bacterium]|nr:hypothetical protein [Pirellulales bacterium]
MINFCWSLFKLSAGVALVLGIGAAMYFYTQMDDQVRRYAEQSLAEHFPHLDVSVGGARIVEGHGIALYDVVLSEPATVGADATLLVIDEFLMECDAQIASLVAGPPEVHRLVVKRPQAWLRRETGGRWNIETLLPLPKTQQTRPTIVVQSGSVSLSDMSRPHLPPLDIREINLTCKPLAEPVRAPGAPPSTLPATEIMGTFTGPRLREAQLQGTCDGIHFRAGLRVKDLRLGGDLWKWLAEHSQQTLASTEVDGRIDGSASLVWQLGSKAAPMVGANLSLTKGRIHDERLPRQITDLAGSLVVEEGAVRVEQLRGKCGSATFALAMRREGLTARAPLALAGQITNLPLDPRLYETLPEVLRQQWDKFRPAGTVNVDSFQVVFDGQRWRPPAAV